VAFCNSLGESFEDLRPLGSLGVTCVIRDGDRTEQAHVSRSYRAGVDILANSLIDELAREAVRKLRFALSATQPEGGQMPVVMAAGAGGILLHEAIGHAFEADFNRKNESIFSSRLGQVICDNHINIVDDGTLMFNRGSINFDDEGVVGQKTYLVREGRLESYLHDRISARHYGVAPTGNGRRESFRHLPIPRMRSTYMEGGNASEEELIRSVRRGIYVRDFTNGQVQIGAGDFTFFVKSGYLIEEGRLTRPVKDVNVIGNGPQALADIVGVADNPVIDNSTWMCGKEGQSCPVTCGMPSVLVKELTVG
jgi:TldD protein